MDTEEQLAAIRANLKDIEAKSEAASEVAWYKKPATIISIVALSFSFGTTGFSYYNSHNEEVLANRRDVRSILERLSTLPIDNYELMEKYKDKATGQALSGMLNQENVLLATQAAELIERFPKSFTSTEYYAIAYALASSNIMSKVPTMFQHAIDTATSSNDLNTADRGYAAYLYSKGEYSEGKRLYNEALNVWSKFPERNAYVVNSVDLLTLMYWSQSDYTAGEKSDALAHLTEARKKLTLLSPGPYTDTLRAQIEYTATFVEQQNKSSQSTFDNGTEGIILD